MLLLSSTQPQPVAQKAQRVPAHSRAPDATQVSFFNKALQQPSQRLTQGFIWRPKAGLPLGGGNQTLDGKRARQQAQSASTMVGHAKQQ